MKTILILAILAILIIFLTKKLKKPSVVITTTKPPVVNTTTTTIAKTFYTWFITEGNNHGCDDEVGSTKYYTLEKNPNLITKFYTNESLSIVYSPGSGKIGFSPFSGPITLAQYEVDVDDDGNISSFVFCK